MKRTLALIAILLLVFSVAGCGTETTQPTLPTTEYNETNNFSFSPDFPVELQQYCAPWVGDVYTDAAKDDMIHYYFMSGKGMIMEPTESDPHKWGDSTLIVFPNGQTMLIDVGMEAYAPVLAENLKRMGIDRVDFLMVSHPHWDHIGGIIAEQSFLDMIEVGTLLYNGVDRGEKSDLLYKRCHDRNIPVQILKRGDSMDFGAVRMQILWPKEDIAGKKITSTAALNNQSILARFDYKDHSSLFAGDLYAAGESMVLEECRQELDVDLLKAPHHGYSTSSSSYFIEMTSPELTVAMSGYRAAVQWAYEVRGATFLYDRYEGYIHVMSDGTDMTYDTERNMQ